MAVALDGRSNGKIIKWRLGEEKKKSSATRESAATRCRPAGNVPLWHKNLAVQLVA